MSALSSCTALCHVQYYLTRREFTSTKVPSANNECIPTRVSASHWCRPLPLTCHWQQIQGTHQQCVYLLINNCQTNRMPKILSIICTHTYTTALSNNRNQIETVWPQRTKKNKKWWFKIKKYHFGFYAQLYICCIMQHYLLKRKHEWMYHYHTAHCHRLSSGQGSAEDNHWRCWPTWVKNSKKKKRKTQTINACHCTVSIY